MAEVGEAHIEVVPDFSSLIDGFRTLASGLHAMGQIAADLVRDLEARK
ncbi:hypothetical protein J4U02_gp065 [Mycobacterium phage Aziz]|uniref:Uncharacterized protein n=1 Tax=Mycobacterium phage Aziz TaxID=2762281 RepID=A0A7G8LHK3_9CAUD|nr:hypothetical protein J4U02_gp065 [Mycobacterium phage Aziz]ASR75912.1 hypothetical protein SEA_GENEVAB15_66 [Mycobacterium phage GenevaB15]QNJ56725.1 hypothetical protein SEA_AZIZ_65 [Mycobacterium phage Aziz]